jgi:hypothetical protein
VLYSHTFSSQRAPWPCCLRTGNDYWMTIAVVYCPGGNVHRRGLIIWYSETCVLVAPGGLCF